MWTSRAGLKITSNENETSVLTNRNGHLFDNNICVWGGVCVGCVWVLFLFVFFRFYHNLVVLPAVNFSALKQIL